MDLVPESLSCLITVLSSRRGQAESAALASLEGVLFPGKGKAAERGSDRRTGGVRPEPATRPASARRAEPTSLQQPAGSGWLGCCVAARPPPLRHLHDPDRGLRGSRSRSLSLGAGEPVRWLASGHRSVRGDCATLRERAGYVLLPASPPPHPPSSPSRSPSGRRLPPPASPLPGRCSRSRSRWLSGACNSRSSLASSRAPAGPFLRSPRWHTPATAWSCQDGRPAARVAPGSPARRLRADEAEKPPQGDLAEPGSSGRELLRRRQAAGLQRQRLAATEGQTGARKGARLLPGPGTAPARTRLLFLRAEAGMWWALDGETLGLGGGRHWGLVYSPSSNLNRLQRARLQEEETGQGGLPGRGLGQPTSAFPGRSSEYWLLRNVTSTPLCRTELLVLSSRGVLFRCHLQEAECCSGNPACTF